MLAVLDSRGEPAGTGWSRPLVLRQEPISSQGQPSITDKPASNHTHTHTHTQTLTQVKRDIKNRQKCMTSSVITTYNVCMFGVRKLQEQQIN